MFSFGRFEGAFGKRDMFWSWQGRAHRKTANKLGMAFRLDENAATKTTLVIQGQKEDRLPCPVR